MKTLLITTEKFRRANISTMYRASICIAIAAKPGITKTNLAALMKTSRESIRVALCDLESLGLLYTTQVLHKNNRKKDTKAFPTPYLKDILADIHYEFQQPTKEQ